MKRIGCRPLLFGSMALLGGLATAAEDGTVQQCATIRDDSARLACYDAAFGRPASSSDPTQASTAARGTAKVAPPRPVIATDAPGVSPSDEVAKAQQEFGLTEAAKRAREPARAEEPSSITGTVVEAKKRPTGEWVVTLEDGQVWAQVESTTHATFKAGDIVTIRKASLGSFVLVSTNRIAMRARRLK